jgi:hypothetical protein
MQYTTHPNTSTPQTTIYTPLTPTSNSLKPKPKKLLLLILILLPLLYIPLHPTSDKTTHSLATLQRLENSDNKFNIFVNAYKSCDPDAFTCKFLLSKFRIFSKTVYGPGAVVSFYKNGNKQGQPEVQTSGNFDSSLKFTWETDPSEDYKATFCYYKKNDKKHEKCGVVDLKTEDQVSSAIYGSFYNVDLDMDYHRKFIKFETRPEE